MHNASICTITRVVRFPSLTQQCKPAIVRRLFQGRISIRAPYHNTSATRNSDASMTSAQSNDRNECRHRVTHAAQRGNGGPLSVALPHGRRLRPPPHPPRPLRPGLGRHRARAPCLAVRSSPSLNLDGVRRCNLHLTPLGRASETTALMEPIHAAYHRPLRCSVPCPLGLDAYSVLGHLREPCG